MTKSLSSEVAKHFVLRAKELGYKGKARDRAAIEFAAGAAAMAVAEHGEESPQWSQLSILFFLVTVHGYSGLEKIANGPAAEAA